MKHHRRNALITKQLYSIPYTIDYHLNDGTLATPNPTSYTIESSEFTLNTPTRSGYTFLGWTMNDVKTYISSSPFGSYGDRSYTAHWKMNVTTSDFSSNISDLVIEASGDENGDGLVDSYSISFKASSSYERINLPITGLIVGQKYRLSFMESNNATNGTMSGYYPSMYGSYVDKAKNVSVGGSVKETSRSQGGLIAEWVGQETGGLSVLDGKGLNGPRSMNVVFTATASTMYWVWDFGLIADGIIFTYNFENITLTPVVPDILFNSMALKDDDVYVATFQIKSYDAYNLKFTFEFDGESGTELLYYPISGLTVGSTYKITFKHTYDGKFINGNGGTYEYGCGILADASKAALAPKMTGVSSSWLSNIFVMNAVSGGTETVTLTFTATSETVYWVWNMANVSDTTLATIGLHVTGFSATHNGNSIDYI